MKGRFIALKDARHWDIAGVDPTVFFDAKRSCTMASRRAKRRVLSAERLRRDPARRTGMRIDARCKEALQ